MPRLSVPVEWHVSGVNPVGEGDSSATLQQQPCSMGGEGEKGREEVRGEKEGR